MLGFRASANFWYAVGIYGFGSFGPGLKKRRLTAGSVRRGADGLSLGGGAKVSRLLYASRTTRPTTYLDWVNGLEFWL